MKLSQEHTDYIKTAFQDMRSKDDLLQLLNYSKRLVYGEKAIPFELSQITWYSNPNLCKNRYTQFSIKKKSGTERTIHAPVNGLKSIQKALSLVLQCVFEPHKAATGFVIGKSIVDNATIHVGSNYVYNIDLKDFFPSIDQARVWKCLQLIPFNLGIKKMENDGVLVDAIMKEHLSTIKETIAVNNDQDIFGSDIHDNTFYSTIKNLNFPTKEKPNLLIGKAILYSPLKSGKSYQVLAVFNSNEEAMNSFPDYEVVFKKFYENERLRLANIISSLCCTEIEVERKDENGNWIKTRKKVLPQGAPTSPAITNVICQRLDFLLTGVGKRFGLKYSRYADDITFSSMHNVYQNDSEFIKEINRIISEQRFHIKDSKTRLQKQGYRQEVTGLLVNERANVQKRYIKQLRMWLYYWETYGYERASGFFMQKYVADKGHVKKSKPDMPSVILGKLDYLKMVKGGQNEMYLKLRGKYDALIHKNTQKTPFQSMDSQRSNLSFSSLKLITDPNLIEETPEEFEIVDKIENVISSINKMDVPKDLTNKLKININQLDSMNGKLNKDIIYRKGESLPIEKFEDNIEQSYSAKKHRPTETKSFLSLFNNSEGLKYLTHKFNDGKRRYENFIELCRREFEIAKSDYPNVPDALIRRIEEFSFSKNPEWFVRNGDEKFFPRKGWSELSFIKWYQKDINIHPGYDSKWNHDMIVPFKETIEVRAGNLKNIIDDSLKTSLGESRRNFIITQNEMEINTAEFYTDVDKFKSALFHIFSTIKERADKNFCFQIHVNYINGTLTGDDFKKVIITHFESEPTKNSNDKNFAKGDIKTIQSQLWGLCNYEIAAKFPDGFRRRIILTDNYNEYQTYVEEAKSIPVDETMTVRGFTHILKFY
ncbi:MAG: reverse transcriptase family protein [Ginsengibacter sp.]